MASGIYTRALYQIMKGDLDLETATIKVMLLDGSGYTFDADHDYISSGAGTVGGNEIPTVASYAGGYGGAGRKLVVNPSVTIDDATNKAIFGCTTANTWVALNDGVVGSAVIIQETGGSDATSILIAHIDNASQFPITTNGGDISIVWNASGIFTISNA